MDGHTFPELFGPQTDEEIEEQERRDAEALSYEYWKAEWNRQTLNGMPYNPPKLTEAQRRGTMTEDEYESYLADCDSWENIQEP